MRRTLKLAALMLLVLVIAVVVLVENRADEKLPPPDPMTPIHLEDGTVLPLSAVVEQARAGTLVAPREDDEKRWKAPTTPSPEMAARIAAIREANTAGIQAELEKQPPLYRLAEQALGEGRVDEAMALYASLPEEDPCWPRAQRRIAWDILTEQRGQPQQAVRYVQSALMAEPLEGNSWQDLARVYAGTLGLQID